MKEIIKQLREINKRFQIEVLRSGFKGITEEQCEKVYNDFMEAQDEK